MGLSEETLQILNEIGFEHPTEIQEKAIPYLLTEYIDFIGLAQTGTGKTAAFGLPIIERIDPDHGQTQVLILAPTRELCQQITEQMYTFSKYHKGINMLAVYGGSPISKQIKALKSKTQHIIIATPGRLIDLIKKKYVKLEGIHLVVLDEADEMLNMGFKEEIDEILKFTPEDKMTWLFSATMPDPIKKIINDYMESPFEVKVKTKEKVNVNIEHQYVSVAGRDKTEALKRLIDIHQEIKAVVFCRTKRDTQNLAEVLLKENYKADALHGDLSQEQRDRVMKRFKNESIDILIATDVAARGIDVKDLSHVIHFSLPDDNAYYTHRSGRTARAGKEGISLAIVNPSDNYKLRRLEKQLGITFKRMLVPTKSEILESRVKKWCNNVLSFSSKQKEDSDILDIANMFFANLSKEELIGKLVSKELSENLTIGDSDINLNQSSKRETKERRGSKKSRQGKFNKNKRSRSRNSSKDSNSGRGRSGKSKSSKGRSSKGKRR